ncbi:MAG: hypothetical protein GX803_01360 [Lentisphaerae bacterium]|nr:hypothetical protein [Lentisphaerota bacterium]
MKLTDILPGLPSFTCPECGRDLPIEDVNVAQDMALCRECGYQGPFLKTLHVPNLSDEELLKPPRRVTLQRDFGDVLVIRHRPSRSMLWFMIPFTLIWGGSTVAVIAATWFKPEELDWPVALISIPFVLVALAMAVSVLYTLAGAATVRIAKGRVEVFAGLGGIGRRKALDCEPGTTVRLEKSNYHVNNVPQLQIVLESGERKLKFGSMTWANDVQPYVAGVLRRTVAGGRGRA